MMLKQTLASGAAALAILAVAMPAAAQQRNFDLPAQDAAPAISAFARQAGLQVVAPADGLGGIRTQALKGSMDARAALRKLIAGTGLEIASDSNGVIVLRRAPTPATGATTPAAAEAVAAEPAALDTIIVTAQKREESAQGVPISLTAFGPHAGHLSRREPARRFAPDARPAGLVLQPEQPDDRHSRRDQHLLADRRQQAGCGRAR